MKRNSKMRIGSLDVHKRNVVVYVLDVFFDGEEISAKSLLVRVFPRFLVGLADLADFLRENSVKKVVMEPSDPYGLKVYSFLESEDFDVWMVPAKDNKPRNQKKTDSEDAERLARGFVAGAVRAYRFRIL